MEYREIDRVPDFKPDIDENLLDKLEDEDPIKSILINGNVTRQYAKWACEISRLAFNLSLQNEKRIDRFQNWLLITVGAIFISALMKLLFMKVL